MVTWHLNTLVKFLKLGALLERYRQLIHVCGVNLRRKDGQEHKLYRTAATPIANVNIYFNLTEKITAKIL